MRIKFDCAAMAFADSSWLYSRHGAFETFDKGGHGEAFIAESLRAVDDLDVGALADEFVTSAFIRVLEVSAAAGVVYDDNLKIGGAGRTRAIKP